MEEINWGPTIFIALIFLVIGGVFTYGFFPRTVDGEGNLDSELLAEAVAQAVKDKDAQIDLLKKQITESESKNVTETGTEEVEEVEEVFDKITGYIIDGIFLNESFNDNIYNRKFKTLFDGDVEFDDKDYDAKEILTITNLTLMANEYDFNGKPYLTIPEGGISYKFTFKESLNTIEINPDETLKFNLLGNEVEVSKWNEGEITFFKGTEHYLKQGESVTYENKTISLDSVYDGKVYVSIGDETRRIKEGDTATFKGMEVYCKEVDYQAYEGGYRQASIVIGKEVESNIKDGEEYEEDSIWEWSIDSNSIGLILVEEFVEIDEDEEYNALNIGEKICLPNNYTCIEYNGIIEEDTEEYKFGIENDYVEVRGDFISDGKEYEKIYIFNDGLIYEDDDTEDYIGEEVELGDSDSVMFSDGTGIEIKNSESGDRLFYVNLDLMSVFVDRDNKEDISMDENWNNISNKDEDYRSNYGILIIEPEDSCEEQEFRITIPEEKVEATISVY